MKQEGVIINKKEHPDIYEWLSKNLLYYKIYQEKFTLTSEGKINAYCSVYLRKYTKQIKYPFGVVKDNFTCNKCKYLTSLVGSPKEVGGCFDCDYCDSLTSLIGAPEKVKGAFCCNYCACLTSLIGFPKYIEGYINLFNKEFSNDPSKKERYKLYLAMWLELLESATNKEREIYIKNYKDRRDDDPKYSNQPIIPIEILKEYGF